MRRNIAIGVTAAWLTGLGGVDVLTQVESEEPYLLLSAKSTGTMQREVDEAATRGYVVRLVAPTSGQEVLVLMERTPYRPRSYRLLATTRTGTMEGELNQAARDGYPLVRGSAIAKALATSGFLPGGQEEELLAAVCSP